MRSNRSDDAASVSPAPVTTSEVSSRVNAVRRSKIESMAPEPGLVGAGGRGAGSDELDTAIPTPNGAVKRRINPGRNLPAAIGVGVALGLLIIVVLTFAPLWWIAIVAIAAAIAIWEVSKRLRQARIRIARLPILVGGEAMIFVGQPFGTMGALMALAATVLVLMIWHLLAQGLHQPPQNYLRDLSVSVFVTMWIPLFASFAAMLVLPHDGSWRVLTLMLAVVCSDVGGYAAGVLFGRHPMAPAISPKKSWEGFAGSLVAGAVGTSLTVHYLLDQALWLGAVMGIIIVVCATLGDLVESQVKRDIGIKDMGTLLPGHGGIMDRLDSVLPSAFVVWAILSVVQ